VVRTKGYGSPEFKPSDPKKQGREPVEIASAALSADGKTLSLSLPGLRPVHSLVLRFRLKAADGSPAVSELDYTLHQVPGYLR
jgi:hypothetical protein